MTYKIPEGTFTESSKDIKVVLTCKSKTMNGEWVSASLDLTDLTDPRIENLNGVLHKYD